MAKNRSMLCAAVVAAAAGGVAHADVITNWNQMLYQSIRTTGGGPTGMSRAVASYTSVMYDSINAIDLANSGGIGYQPVKYFGAAITGSSREAAAAQAAHGVFSALYGASNPGLQAAYDAQLAADLAGIPNGAAKTNGINLGNSVAMNLITSHLATDNTGNTDPYVPGTNAGDWRPTVDTPAIPGVGHGNNWYQGSTWVMSSPSAFRSELNYPGSPFSFASMSDLLASPEYAAQVNDVELKGARVGATRTADQEELAWFWANDRDGTYKPPAHMISLTDEVAQQQGVTDLSERARLFAMVGVSQADTVFAVWDSKYATDIDLWRPTDAIRETQDDGNASTTPDAGWLPLNDFQPPFPAYTSGHSGMGGSWAAALATFFGTDNITFSGTTDEFIVNPFLDDIQYPDDLTRTWNSFSEAGFEDAISRVFLGVHYEWDCVDAYNLGRTVTDFVLANAFQPIPTPGAGLALGLGVFAMTRRRR